MRCDQIHRQPCPSAIFRRPSCRAAFTVFEVMVSATILALVISTSLVVLQTGMRAVDTARNTTLAGQISQSVLEVMRLQNWTQISALPAYSSVSVSDAITSGTSTALDAALNTVTYRFSCTRTVSTPKPNLRLITVTVSWRGIDGRPHSLTSQARYAKHGLNDYIYISH
jgi:type II secretory pathway pseudopilin PulG